MNTDFEYYYNNVPGKGLCRNNLIYTSLINKNKTQFVQWYHNDTDYHKGKNEVVDPYLMREKFDREVHFLTVMKESYPHLIPTYSVDVLERKIYLDINGDDFWEQAGCLEQNYDRVLPDWQDQMLEIFQAYKDLGIYKYSIHPSSYFIVDGKLKSINYFFTYNKAEPNITISSVLSHISEDRRKELFPIIESMGMDVNVPTEFKDLQMLALDSFSNNYPKDFIEKAKEIFK